MRPSSRRTHAGVTFVLPCLNEARTLAAVLGELRAMCSAAWPQRPTQIVVVDNGSTDGSERMARTFGVRRVSWPRRGYGEAVLCGIREAMHPYILCMDSDGTYDAAAVPALVACLDQGAILAVGSRSRVRPVPGSVNRLHHHLGTPLLTWAVNTLHGRSGGPRLTDVTSGQYAFRKDWAMSQRWLSRGFDLNVEFFARALREGVPIGEVPTTPRPPAPGRRSHLSTWTDGARLLARIVGLAWASNSRNRTQYSGL